MTKNKMITLNTIDGEKQEVELLCAFENEKNKNSYVIITKNELDESKNTIIYTGKIEKNNESLILTNIDNDSEWEELKSIMKSMAKLNEEGTK